MPFSTPNTDPLVEQRLQTPHTSRSDTNRFEEQRLHTPWARQTTWASTLWGFDSQLRQHKHVMLPYPTSASYCTLIRYLHGETIVSEISLEAIITLSFDVMQKLGVDSDRAGDVANAITSMFRPRVHERADKLMWAIDSCAVGLQRSVLEGRLDKKDLNWYLDGALFDFNLHIDALTLVRLPLLDVQGPMIKQLYSTKAFEKADRLVCETIEIMTKWHTAVLDKKAVRQADDEDHIRRCVQDGLDAHVWVQLFGKGAMLALVNVDFFSTDSFLLEITVAQVLRMVPGLANAFKKYEEAFEKWAELKELYGL